MSLSAAGQAQAEVKTREKSQVKLEGMLGRMAGMFGGKAVKEGVISSTAVKGNRKATMNDMRGQIVDLSEEKVYDLDMQKKTYEVTTFDEIRRRMREAQEKARRKRRRNRASPRSRSRPDSRRKSTSTSTSRKPARRSRSPATTRAR